MRGRSIYTKGRNSKAGYPKESEKSEVGREGSSHFKMLHMWLGRSDPFPRESLLSMVFWT